MEQPGEGDKTTTNVQKTVKRKVAMHIAYVGTAFRGLQAQQNEHPLGEGDMVEDALAAALVKAGAVTANNGTDLKKINWSRSSRTDKGVHALGGVVAFKCEFPPDHDFESDPEGLNMAQAINEHLPRAVKVLSLQRVNKGFDARERCGERTYHYWLPISAVGITMDGGEEDQRRLHLIRDCLALYKGSHPFHNYTKRRLYRPEHRLKNVQRAQDKRSRIAREDPSHWSSKATAQLPTDGAVADLATDGAITTAASTAATDDVGPAGTGYDASADGSSAQQGKRQRSISAAEVGEVEEEGDEDDEDDNPQDRDYHQPVGWNSKMSQEDKIDKAHYRFIRESYMEGPMSLAPGGPPALKIVFTGSSFMLHQIRHMVGGAVAVALGLAPLQLIKASLAVPARTALPLVPGNPLMLAANEFHPFRRNTHPESGSSSVEALSGERLTLRDGGTALGDAFTKNVLLPAINELIQGEQWDKFNDAMKRLQWHPEELADFLAASAAWTENRPSSRPTAQQITSAKPPPQQSPASERTPASEVPSDRKLAATPTGE
eukprot:CAMPEP_0206148292 /NCGR_PEP_ID=MMETSP1473-20131121/36198_1 /ASSEMBLY_ACC=CAM_ASM_001109 /TAXON_ID=1461547 /ORGANISM="Stichococcus sp, Strain RCC1054" /LENGTH=546 /DNA_ID=CAMNT_0053545583 /DNA_START=349 /DNA_END=1989 /DNA_ORIENTATION=-